MTRTSALLVVSLALAAGPAVTAQRPKLDLIGLLQTYQAGNFDEAVQQAAAREDLGPVRLQLVRDVPGWIHGGPPGAPSPGSGARLRATAAFLVELTHRRLESDWGRFHDLIEWMCVQLRAAGPATAFEREWYAATVALASRARVRQWLLGEFPRLPHQPVRKRPPSKNSNPPPAHLLHAIERVPDDPRLRLAEVAAWLWGRDQEPTRNGRVIIIGPMTSNSPRLEALTALQPLTADPVVGAEARLRIGHVHFSLGDYPAALAAYHAAARDATDVPTRYLAHFCAGRTLEALNRPDEALPQYAQALDVVPGAESASVALAALQFVGDNRDAAVARISRTFAQRPASTDPGRLIGYGSYMHWPQLQAALRAQVGK